MQSGECYDLVRPSAARAVGTEKGEGFAAEKQRFLTGKKKAPVTAGSRVRKICRPIMEAYVEINHQNRCRW